MVSGHGYVLWEEAGRKEVRGGGGGGGGPPRSSGVLSKPPSL